MPWSDNEICNLALSHIGSGEEIANLESESSPEARACRRFFKVVRESMFRAMAWPFATQILALGLIEEDPNSEWDFSYKYPVDAAWIRRILSGQRTDDRNSAVPYKIIQGEAGLLLLTDKEDAEAEITLKVDDPSRFPSDFALCFSLRLGFYIAPRLVGTNSLKVRDAINAIYKIEMSRAAYAAANEEKADMNIESEFITVRS